MKNLILAILLLVIVSLTGCNSALLRRVPEDTAKYNYIKSDGEILQIRRTDGKRIVMTKDESRETNKVDSETKETFADEIFDKRHNP